MKRILLVSAALALPLGFAGCSTASVTETEQAYVEQNEQMSEAMQKEISSLNKLTRIYIDAAALYKQAADIPDQQGTALKDALLNLAKEKNLQRDLLQDRVIEAGGKPAERGQALGTGHRAFTSLRTVINNDTEVALEEVLRSERYIRDEIDKALKVAVTAESRTLLGELHTDAEAKITSLEALNEAV